MPDIAMCQGIGCKKKDTCRRFVATPSPNQCWANFWTLAHCTMYMRLRSSKKPSDDAGLKSTSNGSMI